MKRKKPKKKQTEEEKVIYLPQSLSIDDLEGTLEEIEESKKETIVEKINKAKKS